MFASSWRYRADSTPGHVTAAGAESIRYLQPTPVAAGHAAKKERPLLGRIGQLIAVWHRRHHDRAVLRSLSPREISDFCPRQAEVEAEMHKPFWRA